MNVWDSLFRKTGFSISNILQLLKPNPDKSYKGYEKIPGGFYQPFSMLANQEIQAVIDGKKSANEALKTIQDKGQEQLLQAKQADDAQKEVQSKPK